MLEGLAQRRRRHGDSIQHVTQLGERERDWLCQVSLQSRVNFAAQFLPDYQPTIVNVLFHARQHEERLHLLQNEWKNIIKKHLFLWAIGYGNAMECRLSSKLSMASPQRWLVGDDYASWEKDATKTMATFKYIMTMRITTIIINIMIIIVINDNNNNTTNNNNDILFVLYIYI